MLPDSHHGPTGEPKPSTRIRVARAILVDLRLPPGRVRFRDRAMFPAAVPETPVYEDGDPFTREDDVRAAPQLGERAHMNPESVSVSVQLGSQETLRFRVASRLRNHPPSRRRR